MPPSSWEAAARVAVLEVGIAGGHLLRVIGSRVSDGGAPQSMASRSSMAIE
jgi:hypothetical protein